jgi:hypothetical protein
MVQDISVPTRRGVRRSRRTAAASFRDGQQLGTKQTEEILEKKDRSRRAHAVEPRIGAGGGERKEPFPGFFTERVKENAVFRYEHDQIALPEQRTDLAKDRGDAESSVEAQVDDRAVQRGLHGPAVEAVIEPAAADEDDPARAFPLQHVDLVDNGRKLMIIGRERNGRCSQYDQQCGNPDLTMNLIRDVLRTGNR